MSGFRFAAIFLVFLCIFVYAIEIAYPDFVLGNFALDSSEIIQKPWTTATYMFLHSPESLSHIFYNMFALGLFGSILEKIIGWKRFVLLFLIAGIVSGMAAAVFYKSTIGASGAIFGILGTLGILRPKMTVWVMGIPMPMVAALGAWALLDLAGFFMPGNVANAAHIAGLAAGVLYGILVRKSFSEVRANHEIKDSELEIWNG